MFANKFKATLTDAEQRHTAISSLVALTVRVAGAGMAFLFTLLITRQLGAEQSGYFFLAFTLITFLSAIARLGFDNTIIRFTGPAVKNKYGQTTRSILNFSLCYSLPMSVIFAGLIFLLAKPLSDLVFNKPELLAVLQNMAPALIALSAVTLIAMSLQARQQLIASISALSISHFVLCCSLILFLGLSTSSDIANAFSLSLIITAIGYYLYWRKGLSLAGESICPSVMWYSARPNWTIMTMSQLLLWIGPLIAGVWLSSADVAYLSVAQRVAALTSFILMAVNLVVASKFAAFYAENDMVSVRKTALFSVRLLVVSAVPLLAAMLLFPGFLMGLFGEDFAQGALLLQILALGQFVNVITGSVGYLLMMSGHERDLRTSTMISGGLVVILTIILTQYFGVVGCAIATAISLAFQNLLAAYFVKKRLGFNTLKFWQKI
jgi:O-antigen/teichoic acid export membrane protein